MSHLTDNPAPPRHRPTDVLRGYVALTKPRVIELLLVTTIPAMLLAERGVPSLWLILATLVGGTMAAGSANTLNCVADADIDAQMKRTSARPLVTHQVPVRAALVFGIVLGVLAFGWLWATANLLSALLAVTTILFYVFVYTLLLKRRTAQNVRRPVTGWCRVVGEVAHRTPFLRALRGRRAAVTVAPRSSRRGLGTRAHRGSPPREGSGQRSRMAPLLPWYCCPMVVATRPSSRLGGDPAADITNAGRPH